MLLLGIDIGTSSIKVSVVDAATGSCLSSASYPDKETSIISTNPGWAEQSPDLWWENVQQAILRSHSSKLYDPSLIAAIGIAYQMHGLVLIDKDQVALGNSIIWCDSRAVDIGNKAFLDIGRERCLNTLLNSPGNFTASRLSWVKENAGHLYKNANHFLLPGDFIAMKFTGEISTTISALSEGIFWDFQQNELSKELMTYFGFENDLVPAIKDVFSVHGHLRTDVAKALSLTPGIPVSYKAGDQLNNALSLNVLEPGEVAANAGTSGVIYGVTEELVYDTGSRINAFAHVNHQATKRRLGILLCINGSGILYRWVKDLAGNELSYEQMNAEAAQAPAGSGGLQFLPFGNGSERILGNRNIHAHLLEIDLNKHGKASVFRAAQEGIAFAFRFGLDIMREAGMHPQTIRAGNANLFKSPVFVKSFVNTVNVPVEIYSNDGSIGAAIGAGIGAKIYKEISHAFREFKFTHREEPAEPALYEELYQRWKNKLNQFLCQQ